MRCVVYCAGLSVRAMTVLNTARLSACAQRLASLPVPTDTQTQHSGSDSTGPTASGDQHVMMSQDMRADGEGVLDARLDRFSDQFSLRNQVLQGVIQPHALERAPQ